ncbi:MAG TPA: hypothetical protein VG603_07005 [Chitinophagales bacterium]|nr:hypothetical protein [Chitinophagales bacterium]
MKAFYQYCGLITLVLAGFTACQTNHSDSLTQGAKPVTDSFPNRNIHYPNLISSQTFGDSIRLEVEKRGDTLIKHYIDLKGTADDNFDDSYDATCTYRYIANGPSPQDAYQLNALQYRFLFDSKAIGLWCDSVVDKIASDPDSRIEKKNVYYLQKVVRNKLQGDYYFVLPELLEHFAPHIERTDNGPEPLGVLVEYYSTEFSGGKNYSIVTAHDTTNFIHHNDYMR